MSGWRRPAAVAGLFYPGTAHALAVAVDELLSGVDAADAAAAAGADGAVRAVIAPHAGYVYSGPVAASAYTALHSVAGELRRVAILGPSHHVPLVGAAVPAADTWSTPLGDMPIDPDLRALAIDAGAMVDDVPHAREHAVEVQLPFLQRLCSPSLAVLPVAVGSSTPDQAADLVAALWEEADALVVSTDLSHYLAHDAARRADRRTAEAILACRVEAIGSHDACGCDALRGLLLHASRIGASVRLLDLRTSADTAGDPDRVVGYGAFAIG